MWLIRLVKKLLSFAIAIAIISGFAIVFIGSFWFDNNYNINEWSGLLQDPTNGIPSGVLTGMFGGVSNWYNSTLNGYNENLQSLFRFLIPVGFAAVFGIVLYTAASILFHLIKKAFTRKKK